MAGDLRLEVDVLGRVVNELLEGMRHGAKALEGLIEVNGKLRRDLDKLLAACELMADHADALTAKVYTIERKVYNLPDNVTVLRPDS